jgi:hypothetical protein
MNLFKLLILTLFVTTAFSAVPGTGKDSTYKAPEESQILRYTTEEEEQNWIDELKTAEQFDSQSIVNNTKQKKKWFLDTEPSQCDYESFRCPDLTKEVAKSGAYSVKMTKIYPSSGKMTCEVFKQSFDEKNEAFTPPVYSKTIEIKACRDKFSKIKHTPYVDDEIANLIQVQRENELEIQASLEEIEANFDTEKTYLDFADLMDAISGMDLMVIDAEKTVNTGELTLSEQYTIYSNQINVETVKDNLEILFKNDVELTQEEIDSRIAEVSFYKEKHAKLLNTEVAAGIGYVLSINEHLTSLLNALILIIIMIKVLLFASKTGVQAVAEQDEQAPYHSLVPGVFLAFMIVTGPAENITVTNNEVVQEIEVKIARYKEILVFANRNFNEIADEMAKTLIQWKLTSMIWRENTFDSTRIEKMATEKMRLKEENKFLAHFETEVCQNLYNLVEVRSNMKVKLDKNVRLSQKKDESLLITQLALIDVNPYPRSEKEAFEISGPYINPYYSPLVNRENEKFKEMINKDTFISFSGCYFNRKNMITNNQKIKRIEKKLEDIEEAVVDNHKKEKYEYLFSLMWQKHKEMGYYSLLYLATLDTVEFMNSSSNYEDSTLTGLAQDIAVLTLFGGSDIKKMLDETAGVTLTKVKDLIAKGLAEIPVIGGFLGGGVDVIGKEAIELSMWKAAALSIYAIIDSVVIVLSIVLLLAYFLFIALLKLIITIFLPFGAVFWMFSKDNSERIFETIEKVLSVYLRVVILIVSFGLLALLFAIINYFDTVISNDLVAVMKQSVDTEELGYSIVKWVEEVARNYIFIGVLHLVFLILKIGGVYFLIFKAPSLAIELIMNGTKGFGEGIIESMNQKTSNQLERKGM